MRHAEEGEKIVTLDENERILSSSDLVIADGSNTAACIAGVMGGLNSEVTESTKNVLLEAAVFDSASIRRTSRRLGLRSEASGRYEKGINLQERKWPLIESASFWKNREPARLHPEWLMNIRSKLSRRSSLHL